MPLVSAKCTACGASIKIDDSKESGYCEYCGTQYITEKVINNYNVSGNINIDNATINIVGGDVNNLLKRAAQCEEVGDLTSAKDYYSKVLDIDPDNEIAKAKVYDEYKRSYIGEIEVSSEVMAAIKRMLPNEKLAAIRQIREVTGLGLAEAKFFAERFDEIEKSTPQTPPNFGLATAKGGCYVATAVYGSYDCPQVWTLRRYRDNILAKSWYGRGFIHVYYAVSPTIVKLFGRTAWFNKIWKKKLDAMVADFNAKGIENTRYEDKDW